MPRLIAKRAVPSAAVYDITTEKNHNFFANGILVHNCGEQTLAPAGVCDLGTINLTQFINKERTGVDQDKLKKYVRVLNRFLDNVNDVSIEPLPEYNEMKAKKRRVGIGVLGWGSLLYMLKIPFGSPQSEDLRDSIMQTVSTEAYRSSIDLAEEKGMFPLCNPTLHAIAPFVQSLNLGEEYMDKLRRVGIRNSALLSCQPNGNTSIFANVSSSGVEPVFNPEYDRTIILTSTPDEIKDLTPRWEEGEFAETSLFKFVKEGTDVLLRGEFDGVVYKIDKNRGLTKVVSCIDYGVRKLKEWGEWDPKAPWVVTAMSITPEQHLSDLRGFARYVDSAISKTINVPNDYPYESFKNIYLDAYKSKYIKGITTYRAGTMANVLSVKEENAGFDEEIILDDVKIPNQTNATMNVIRAEGKKWYVSVVMDQGRPVAFFVNTNHHEKTATTNDAVDCLIRLAKEKNIPEKWIEDTIQKIERDNNVTKVARCISLNLRHGVQIKNVVSALSDVEGAFVGTFVFQIRKYLMSWIKDGEKVQNGDCPDCGAHGSFVFAEGCMKCTNCGYSKCG